MCVGDRFVKEEAASMSILLSCDGGGVARM